MKTRTSLSLMLPTVFLLAGGPLYAADESAEVEGQVNESSTATEITAATTTTSETRTTGEITTKLYVFDYFSGFGEDRTQFVERYNYQKGFSGDRRSDFFVDADFRLKVVDDDRELLSIERLGFGRHNQRGTLEANRETFGIEAYYSQFRSATGGLDWLFSPNQVPGGTELAAFFPAQTNTNSGFLAQFNDDSGRTRFDVKRVSYGAAVKIKPVVFEDRGSIKVGYDGYQRTGNQLTSFVLGGGDIREAGTNAQTSGRVLQRWRGINQDIDESVNRFKLTLAGTPGNKLVLAYDFSWDKFNNNGTDLIHSDVVPFLGSEWQYNTGGDATRPLGFAPESHQFRHGLRASRTFGKTAISGGFGQSWLEQDSFTQPQTRAGFVGKTSTDNAFFNIASNVVAGVRLEGFLRYYQRDNDSTFPAPGLIDPFAGEQLGVRVNEIETYTYGANASWRSRTLDSNFILGWKHEDKQRDLTFSGASVDPTLNGITAERSLFREDTEYDEVSLKIVSRLGNSTTLRLTPSYLWADKVGLVTDPETSFQFKSNLGHVTEAGTLFNAYYNYRGRKNNDLSFLGTDGNLATQDLDRSTQSAGLSVGWNPSEWISAQTSIAWLQDDFTALFYGSNRRRFEGPNNPVIFFLRDESSYDVDTYVATASADWQASDSLSYQFGYTFSRSDGKTASGVIFDELPTQDGRIDNTLHSLQVGLRYQYTQKIGVSGMYVIDYYTDDAFDDLTGGVHSLMLGLTVAF
ncbi:MAG: hypothetical protein U1A22_00165 [Xanthomonadaceae bacterium]|nr:hypothetical protein [Xanthomonadaceae bacterium]